MGHSFVPTVPGRRYAYMLYVHDIPGTKGGKNKIEDINYVCTRESERETLMLCAYILIIFFISCSL